MPSNRKSAFGGHTSAAVQAKPVTRAPTIQKRPSRPRATAAVHEVTHRLTTRGLRHRRQSSSSRSVSHSPDPSPSSPHISVIGTDRIEALERENESLKLSVDAISDSLNEVKEMLQRLCSISKVVWHNKAKERFWALVPCLDLDYLLV